MISKTWEELPHSVICRLDEESGWYSSTVLHKQWISNLTDLMIPFNAIIGDDDIIHFKTEANYIMFILRFG